MNLKKMCFDKEVLNSKINKEIKPLLLKEFKFFFELGISEIKKDIIPFIETYDNNKGNENLSDKDFRIFANNIIDAIKEKLYK